MRQILCLMAILAVVLLSGCGVESTPVPPKAKLGVNVSSSGVKTNAAIAFSPLANLRVQIGL